MHNPVEVGYVNEASGIWYIAYWAQSSSNWKLCIHLGFDRLGGLLNNSEKQSKKICVFGNNKYSVLVNKKVTNNIFLVLSNR